MENLTNLELLMEYMEQNQYFIGNDLLAKYNELLQKEKKEQLRIGGVSGSALIDKAEQMQKENRLLIIEAREYWDKEYKKAIGIGIDRIIKLIKRHYC